MHKKEFNFKPFCMLVTARASELVQPFNKGFDRTFLEPLSLTAGNFFPGNLLDLNTVQLRNCMFFPISPLTCFFLILWKFSTDKGPGSLREKLTRGAGHRTYCTHAQGNFPCKKKKKAVKSRNYSAACIEVHNLYY